MKEQLKIAIAGAGYVGLSLAILLAQNHEVTLVDINEEKIESINNRISPIQDVYIEQYFREKNLIYGLHQTLRRPILKLILCLWPHRPTMMKQVSFLIAQV